MSDESESAVENEDETSANLRKEFEEQRAKWDKLITEIRGVYMNHAINVESKLDSLLVEMYLPRNSSNEYVRRFHSFILGSRGLSFDGKITALRGGLMWRDRTEPLYTNRPTKPPDDPDITPLFSKLGTVRNRRNAIAHAYFNTVSWSEDKDEATFYLNVVTGGGTVKFEHVSIPIVNDWVEVESSIAAELERLTWQYRLGKPVRVEEPEPEEE